MSKKIILYLTISIIFSAKSIAQLNKNSALYNTIILNDSLLFNVGFNQCDIAQFEHLLSEISLRPKKRIM